MKLRLIACLSVMGATGMMAAERTLPTDLEKEAKAALDKGLTWLVSQQKEGGYWSNDRFPALTGLPIWALSAAKDPRYAKPIDNAVKFVLSKAQPDGGIYVPDPRRGGAGLGNYNTSVCMMGLHATGRKDVERVILKARDYTASTQLTGDDEHAGGFGYDQGGRRYTDMNNTGSAIDAMRRTQNLEDNRPAGEKHADLNWDAALKYVTRMQQREGEDKGGFVYTRTAPGGGGRGGAGGAGGAGGMGRPTLNSYGSITYVGMLSLIHCQLTKSDPRVISAFDFCTKHWTLDENPGQGINGLYFYYDVMSRALNALGADSIPQKAGDAIAWREAMIRKIISLQSPEGFWTNESNRWWENDPVLATSYSLIALEVALGIAQ